MHNVVLYVFIYGFIASNIASCLKVWFIFWTEALCANKWFDKEQCCFICCHTVSSVQYGLICRHMFS